MTGLEIVNRITGPKNAQKIYDRKTELFFEWFDRFDEIEGATQTINEFRKRNYNLAIATSGNRRVMDRVIERFGWKFDLIVTAEDVSRGKPDPEMLIKIKSELPAPYLFVGDTQYDLDAGNSAGIKTLLLGRNLVKLTDLLKMKLF